MPIRALFLLSVLFLPGCQRYLIDPSQSARSWVRDAGWSETRFVVPPFRLVGFFRVTPGAETPLHVYIEGDGRAWPSRRQPPDDPTPANPVALRLALADGAPNILYLARPCQFVSGEEGIGCDVRFWTSDRFGETVLIAMNSAITIFAAKHRDRQIVLIGFSGGGAVAALLAARRTDVAALVTVAGTLDHHAWTSYHHASPLTGSENPIDRAKDLRSVPQIHFAGADDEIMPPAVGRSFFSALGNPKTAKFVIVASYDHDCCWQRSWDDRLNRWLKRLIRIHSGSAS